MDGNTMSFLFFASLISFFVLYCYIRGNIEDNQREKAFQAAKAKYTEYYSKHDLRTLTNMPDIYVVAEDNYPREKHIPHGYCYGKTIDVYITRTGEVYHALGCPHAAYAQPRNVFKDYYTYSLYAHRPCSYCKPAPLPEIKWYDQYVTHLDTCRKYGIIPLREPKERT